MDEYKFRKEIHIMWGYNKDYDRYEEKVDDTRYEEVGIRWCLQCKKTVPFFRDKRSGEIRCGNCGMVVF